MPNGERERFEVLLENVNSSLRLVAEGHSALNDKFDGLDKKVDSIDKKVDGVVMDVAVLKADVAVLKADGTVLKGDMRRVKDHLGREPFCLALQAPMTIVRRRRSREIRPAQTVPLPPTPSIRCQEAS